MSGKPTYEELEQRIKTLEQAELQKRKAETALKKEKRRFQQILDSFPFGIYIVDQHYVIEYLNSRIRREFGDPATLKCHEYFHCSSDPCSWCQNEKVFKGQTLYRNSHSPQNERDYELVDIPLYNDDGTVSKLAVFNDITERKQSEAKRKKMEEELIKRNQFIETILDNLPIGLAVNYIDEGKSTYINKKFQEIYGWPEEELADIESFFQNVYPDPQYRDKIRQQVLRDIQSGDPDRMVWEGVKVTAKNGMEKIVSAKNIPLFEQNLMISTVQDITERQTLQAQLQQAQKMEAIGTLAGGIAHDFNNILSVIMGYTELALDKIAKKTGPYDDLQEVFQAGLRARELVKQILTFSRQAEQKIQPVQLNLIVNETLKFLRSSLPASIEIRRNIASKARVLADPTQVHQVLMNLCGNAKHAMRQTGGVIEVELTETLLDADAVAGHQIGRAHV